MKTKEEILDSKLPNRTGYPVETLIPEILSAMQEWGDQQKPKLVYVAYDPSDNEMLVAFIDKEKAETDANESGCQIKELRLVAN